MQANSREQWIELGQSLDKFLSTYLEIFTAAINRKNTLHEECVLRKFLNFGTALSKKGMVKKNKLHVVTQSCRMAFVCWGKWTTISDTALHVHLRFITQWRETM